MNNNDRKFGGRFIDIFLISTIASLIVLIIIFTTANNLHKAQNVSASNPTVNEPGTVNPIEPDISSTVTQEIMNTNIEGIRIVNETLKDPTKPYLIQSIKTNFEPINTAINKYISDSKTQYENIIRLKDKIEPNDSSKNLLNNLNISVEISTHQDQYISLIFTKNIAIRSNQSDTTIYTLFFNNKTGEIINLQKILNGDVKSLTSLSESVRSSILKNPAYEKHINTESLTKVTEPKWNYFQRFSIKDNSLVFYFNKGEIANNSIGIPTTTIPLSSIYKQLAAEFQKGIKDGSIVTTPPPTKDTSSSKKVALTFDDGPHPTITMEILDLLDKYNAKATFFVVGNRIDRYSDVLIETFERGHEIGNHTWNHTNLTTISTNQVKEQLSSTNNAIKKAIGQYPTVFRPPYGAKNNQVVSVIELPVIMWTIDTLDWKYRNASNLLPMVKKSMHNNAIILMHDIHQSTADGLESVLKYLQEQGYEFVTVSEILQYK
ncbi:Peptidoglycan/xylan/chitin deacetylase (PgdA/CDA1 family) OS=Ureibacillus acetophenoni OX=614649 GN=SAMN05877842_115104 PE=4 SV=1 [Ureibacillus acetophenoni]